MNTDGIKDVRGVSPVIGVVLLLAIVVILVGIVGVFLLEQEPPDPTGTYDVSVEASADDVTFTFESVQSPQPITIFVDGTEIGTIDSPSPGDEIVLTGITTGSNVQLVASNNQQTSIVYRKQAQQTSGSGSPTLVNNNAPASGPTVLWQYDMTGCESSGGPTLDGSGTVYVTGNNVDTNCQEIRAISTNDGSEQWRITDNDGRKTFYHVEYQNGLLYYLDSDESFSVYDATDGSFNYEVSYPTSNLGTHDLVSDTYLPISRSDGFSSRGYFMYDAGTGTELYRIDLADTRAPIALDETNDWLVAINNTHLFKYEASTGTLLHSEEMTEFTASKGYIQDGTSVYLIDADSIGEYDMATDSFTWTATHSGLDTWAGSSSFHAADGELYYGDSNTVRVYDATDGNELYSVALDSDVNDVIPADDGNMYVTTDNTLYSLSRSDGSENWTFTTTDEIVAAPNVYDGVVYMTTADYTTGSSSGSLIAVDTGGSATAASEDCGAGFETGGFC